MGKATGFLEYSRELAPRPSGLERVNDWFEIYQDFRKRASASRVRAAWIAECHFARADLPGEQHYSRLERSGYSGRWKEA